MQANRSSAPSAPYAAGLLAAGVLAATLLAACLPALAQFDLSKNLVPNPSFERVMPDGTPAGWSFTDAGAGAKMVVDDTVARSGKRSVKLTNPHARQPNVYGSLFCNVGVKPNTTYTFSLYARSADPGDAWFGGGAKWEHRRSITSTGGKWQRFSLTFKTGPGETSFQPRINVDSKTDGLWIDGVQLEVGSKATALDVPTAPAPGATTVRVEPVAVGANLLGNPSFEEWRNNWPVDWRWDKRNTDATMTLDDTRAHSGRRSVKLTNGTAFHPQVYAQLLYGQPVPVKPNTQYTISAYVQVGSPGVAWIGGARQWRVRAMFPRQPTGKRWVRVKQTFTTEPTENEVRIMINTESPTSGIWVDDAKLEQGPDATPFVLAGDTTPDIDASVVGRASQGLPEMPWEPDRYPPDQYVFASGSLVIEGYATNAAGCTLHARLLVDGNQVVSKTVALPAGDCSAFEVARDLSDVRGGHAKLEVWLQGAAEPASYTQEFTLVTRPEVAARLTALKAKLPKLEAEVKRLGTDGGNYPLVALTAAREFEGFIAYDMDNAQLARAWAELDALDEIIDRDLKATSFPAAPKYVTGPIKISGPSFVGEMRWPDGREVRQPIIEFGMGPFSQARKDVERFPGYSFNIMQVEFGPNSVLPTENTYSDDSINAFRALCQRAAKANVAVNLLISPHYFPEWAMKKWPKLGLGGGGFLRYSVQNPHADQVLGKFLRYAIPRVRDLKALHSICLSNEPILTNTQQCPYARADWHAWLQKRHGTIAALNQAWGSKYASFDDVPMPPTAFQPEPIVYDFVRYNQEAFAGWHKFLADTIHSMAPDIPVHAKMTINNLFSAGAGGPWSLNPYLFGKFCEINGDDGWQNYLGHGGKWAANWQGEIMGYELERCAREAPCFNSEDHMINDRNIDWQSPDYIYNVYWQGAVHGRGASSAWVWERSNNLTSDFTGSILHRPACIDAAGRCTLDANRLAPEITALQARKPRVALVYALSGFVWDGGYPQALSTAWRALDFAGYKPGFVYERQLENLAGGGKLDGYLSDVKIIVTPGLRHLSAKAIQGLDRFVAEGGKIVAYQGFPDANEYGKPVAASAGPAEQVFAKTDELLPFVFRKILGKLGVTPPVELVGDGGPVYGVEYMWAPWKGGLLVNVSNYTTSPVVARLMHDGKPVAQVQDLITGKTLTSPFTIHSLVPRLLAVK